MNAIQTCCAASCCFPKLHFQELCFLPRHGNSRNTVTPFIWHGIALGAFKRPATNSLLRQHFKVLQKYIASGLIWTWMWWLSSFPLAHIKPSSSSVFPQLFLSTTHSPLSPKLLPYCTMGVSFPERLTKSPSRNSCTSELSARKARRQYNCFGNQKSTMTFYE